MGLKILGPCGRPGSNPGGVTSLSERWRGIDIIGHLATVTIYGDRCVLPVYGQIYTSVLTGIEVLHNGNLYEVDISDVEDISESRESW
jgi:hypothetical protein